VEFYETVDKTFITCGNFSGKKTFLMDMERFSSIMYCKDFSALPKGILKCFDLIIAFNEIK